MATTTPVTPIVEQPKYYRLLAPWWHTLILVGIMVLASGGQAHTLNGVVQQHGRMPLYITTIAFEWVLVGFVWLGIHRRGIRLRDLIGGRWKSPEDFLLDGAIAVGFWIVSVAVLAGMQYALGIVKMHDAQNLAKERMAKIGFLFPQTKLEIIFYISLALTAGFCEELICRGYLQKQFHAMTGNVYLAALLQAVVFGAAHGYQGVKLMVVLGTYGFLFGLLAIWRRSLRPGMMTHAWQDLFSGLVGRVILQHMR